MLGRDIEIIDKKRKIKSSNIFYINELSYGVSNKNVERPATVPTVGMDKIQAKGWKGFFIDYASSSSVHGVNHLAAPYRHIIERILAVMFILAAFIGVIFLSLHFWEKYQVAPTIVVLNNDANDFIIEQPAIFICTNEGVDRTKFKEVFEKYGIADTAEMRKFFTKISRHPYGYTDDEPKTVNISSDKWLSILHDLKYEMPVSSKEPNTFAQWVITEYGFCYSFYNYIAPYSSFDYWKNNNWTVIPKIESTRTCRFLSAICKTTIQLKFRNIFFGVAYSGDIVDFLSNIYYVKPKWIGTLIVDIREIGTPDSLRYLTPRQRNCNFPNENPLTMWPIYTSAMCKRECIYKKMLEICGCYHHFARPLAGIPICNLKQLRCITENKEKIMKYDDETKVKCGCTSDCNYIRYIRDDFSKFLMNSDAPEESSVVVDLKFPVDKYIQEEVFGFLDLLAAIGGSAGLLLGASILSFAELFYFGTLRCFWNYMRNIRNQKKRRKPSKEILSLFSH